MRRASLLLLALALAAPLAAQDLPPQGTATTFDVGTWNIEWFGDDDRGPSNEGLQQERAARVLAESEVELWCLQEITEADAFDNLLTALGDGWAGVLAPGSQGQRLAYVYRTDIVQNLSTQEVLTEFAFAFAFRPPLQMRARVRLRDRTEDLRVLCFHAKANVGSTSDRDESYDRRVAASEALKNYADNLASIGTRVLLLGDYNDELGASTFQSRPSPYANFVADAAGYTFATASLDASGTPTFCSNSACSSGSTLDHIAFTANLDGPYVANSGERYDAVIPALSSFVFNTSDHLPVTARFDFGGPVDAEDDGVPARFALDAPFPNPFTDATSVRFALPTASAIDLAVYDALGRRVATLAQGTRAAGTHTVSFEGSGLPAGLYLVRLTADEATATRRLVRVP